MIDIWLLCGLTIPFLVFILEVTSEMIRHHKKQQKHGSAKTSKRLQLRKPTKVKDNMPLLTENTRNISTAEGGSQINEIYNNCATPVAVLKASKGTQADKNDYKPADIPISKDESSVEADTFTLLEKMILRYKQVTIPAITTAFIIGYTITAVTNYTN